MTTVLYVESGSGNGGAATCLASMLQFLDRNVYRPIVAYYNLGVGIQRIQSLGIETVPLPAGRRLWRLLRLIQTRRVDLIHNNDDLYSQMPTMVAVALTRVPCVCSLRMTRPLTRRERLWVPLVRRFVAVSEPTRQAFVETGIPADRIDTIWDGIDPERFSLKRRAGTVPLSAGLVLDPSKLTVGLVGRLIPIKGIREFLDAARLIVDRLRSVQFVLVGSDPMSGEPHMQKWKAQVRRLGLTRQVVFTGWRSDVDAITPLFDVAVQASKYWEGLGTSLLEAMACGKPVVATRIGGVPDVVKDGVTGLLVPPGDSRALAEAVLTLLRDDGLRRRMGEAGRRRVEQLFDQRRLIKDVEQLYAQVLNPSTRAAAFPRGDSGQAGDGSSLGMSPRSGKPEEPPRRGGVGLHGSG